MVRNYFTIAWRSIRKHKVFTAINIVGLSLSMPIAHPIGIMTRSTRKGNYNAWENMWMNYTYMVLKDDSLKREIEALVNEAATQK